ncbi:MAG: molybdopterin molybdotransferase MoeA, partial [Gammaproteobacteria bacterium]|nr:molybdopterin molybdotransferase MoeA [Gammaproteobacteria bacterium]
PANCIEVMTGAVVPALCDCVIPIEEIQLTEQSAELLPDVSPRKSQYIHHRGSDYGKSDLLLEPGTRIGGPEMAVLASAGQATVGLAREPNFFIVAIGDELADPGTELGPSQIRRSNDFAIDTLLKETGFNTTRRSKLPDDPGVLRKTIAELLEQADILILTGGVSMGKYDYIPEIMNSLGVEILLHKIAQKPGKPMWVGRRRDTVVFALPGNPVSSLVCARRYVVPAIQDAMGFRPQQEIARLGRPLHQAVPLTWFVPVILEPHESGMLATPRLTNTSGDFHTLAGTTGFVELAHEQTEFPAGHLAPFWRW